MEKLGFVLVLSAFYGCAIAETLDAKVLKNFGGRYSVDCKDKAADAAVVRPNEISVTLGGQQVVAKELETSLSMYGHYPPKGYQITIIGTLVKDVGLFFDVYRLGQAQYITINGHSEAMKQIGRTDDDAKFVLCSRFTS